MTQSALRAAHLGTTMTSSIEQPSTFDIVSQESLMKSLKPAVGHLLKFLAIAKPQKFTTAYRYYDELYLLFDLLLQNQYLKRYGGTFSENFYSIKRTPLNAHYQPHHLRSLAVESLWPYLRDKLEKIYNRLKEEQSVARNTVNDSKTKLKNMFIAIWPWLKRLLSLSCTVLQILYMINKSSIHSPFLYFAGVKLAKLTPEDISAFDSIPLHLQGSGILNRIYRFFLSLPGVFSRIFGYGLFFVQFIDFMYNSEFSSQFKKTNASWQVPPAPHRVLVEENVQDMDTNKCPLCRKRRVNDTALSVSGYIFCYSCISDYVRRNRACPVTGNPSRMEDLIRLYIQ